ncbi:MAG TPA: kelch repeat-containing protein [Gaiellaceae bacterium]|nr:kelch repeat-containing protein [Gaiellaceae bacterium]
MRVLAAALAAVALVGLAAAVGTLDGATEAEAAPWTYAASMSQRRSYIAAAAIDGEIYAAGGMVGETGRPLDLLARYDPARDEWETLRRLPEPVRAAAAAAVDGVLYVTGGTTREGNSAAVYAYDPARDEWEERAPLPEPRFNHDAVAFDGKVYVLGGYHEGEERREVFVYDPAADAWKEAGELPFPNHAFDAVAFRDEIWMLGGRRGDEILRDVWILDPGTGEWREGPAMPEPMELLGAAVAGDEIHAVWESTYQVYDARAGTWSSGPRSLVTRHGLQTFYLDGVLFTVGGCTTKLVDSQVVERRVLSAS